MAELAAPYLHARLSAATTTINGKAEGDTITNNIVQILAIPRGAELDIKDGKVTIEGSNVELTAVEPFEGTPTLAEDTDKQINKPDSLPSDTLPVHTVDTSNVTRINTDVTIARSFDRASERQHKAQLQEARRIQRERALPPDVA